MVQTIDLRTKEEFLTPPQPPAVETVAEEATLTEEQGQSDPTSWATHLTPPHHRSRVWYMIGILIIAALIAGIFFQDVMFTSVLGLSAFVLVLNAIKPHRLNSIGIHATGISVDDNHHRFAD